MSNCTTCGSKTIGGAPPAKKTKLVSHPKFPGKKYIKKTSVKPVRIPAPKKK